MTKDGSEEGVPLSLPLWPSLRFDFCQIFGFDNACLNQVSYRTWLPLEAQERT